MLLKLDFYSASEPESANMSTAFGRVRVGRAGLGSDTGWLGILELSIEGSKSCGGGGS